MSGHGDPGRPSVAHPSALPVQQLGGRADVEQPGGRDQRRAAGGRAIAAERARRPSPPGQASAAELLDRRGHEVITVVAASTVVDHGDPAGVGQAAAGWTPHGAAITAHVGSAGLTTPSERVGVGDADRQLRADRGPSATTRTRAPRCRITRRRRPTGGSRSTAGRTHRSTTRCRPARRRARSPSGDNPNEHLYYETPYYNYAVVIEYNTTAPVVQGGGSAFFLHVTDGTPTAGCVSIPQAEPGLDHAVAQPGRLAAHPHRRRLTSSARRRRAQQRGPVGSRPRPPAAADGATVPNPSTNGGSSTSHDAAIEPPITTTSAPKRDTGAASAAPSVRSAWSSTGRADRLAGAGAGADLGDVGVVVTGRGSRRPGGSPGATSRPPAARRRRAADAPVRRAARPGRCRRCARRRPNPSRRRCRA